jgi:tRNA/tmRNA/rRNA uracil-C5-methylase (TrmA/RlmC/RlmD family)
LTVETTGIEDIIPELAAEIDDTKNSMRNQVTPFHVLPYQDQLVYKAAMLRASLKKLTVRMESETGFQDESGKATVAPWVKRAKRGPCCPLSAVHPSPSTSGYRNKNEFTIGYERDRRPMVGFRYGRFEDGDKAVGCADGCPHVPEVALAIARALTAYLAAHRDPPCWEPEDHSGTWRSLTVRHSAASGDVLAMVQYASTGLPADRLRAALDQLRDHLVGLATSGQLVMTSLFFQVRATPRNLHQSPSPTSLLHSLTHSLTHSLIYVGRDDLAVLPAPPSAPGLSLH